MNNAAHCIAPLLLTASALAQPVINPANNHGYDGIPGQMSWEEARIAAAALTFRGVPGHLATITSQAESDWLFDTFGPRDTYALGGIQTGGPEPAGGWTWITGEPWGYTRWHPGEPSNNTINGQSEDRLAIFAQTTNWNDVAPNVNQASPTVYRMNGFFVEFPPPAGCYANCDGSTQSPILNVSDFGCFLTKFASGDPYANCDGSTSAPQLNVADFGCFLTKFATGCN